MKKTLFLLLLIPTLASAQVNLPLITDDMDEIFALVEVIQNNAEASYELTQVDTLPGQNFGRMKFVLTSGDDKIFINYLKQTSGGRFYELQYIQGKYVDLFAVWQQYADPEADKASLADKPATWVFTEVYGEKKQLLFSSFGEIWRIQVKGAI